MNGDVVVVALALAFVVYCNVRRWYAARAFRAARARYAENRYR